MILLSAFSLSCKPFSLTQTLDKLMQTQLSFFTDILFISSHRSSNLQLFSTALIQKQIIVLTVYSRDVGKD